MVTDSVVVLVVRKGNPKNIKTWDDLTQPGIGVIEANPFTLRQRALERDGRLRRVDQAGPDRGPGAGQPAKFFENVLVQDTSGRASLQTFLAGQGDVMLAYENEAIAAQQGGQDLDYVVPDSTILIENPAAVTNVGDATDKAKAFLTFADQRRTRRTPLPSKGYRPVIAGVNATGWLSASQRRPGLFTIDDLGGWSTVNTQFFDQDQRHRGQDRAGPRSPPVTRSLSIATGIRGASAPARNASSGRLSASRRAPGSGCSAQESPRSYLGIIVLLPDAALVLHVGLRTALDAFMAAITSRQRSPRCQLTLIAGVRSSSWSTRVMGTLIAWILVRDDFPGQALRQRPHRPALRPADDRGRA